MVPRHQYSELPAVEPGAVGDRRLAGAPRRREGGAGPRHDHPDRQRHRADRDRQDHRDCFGSRVEGGECRLPVVRHRLAGRRIRPWDGLAGAGRTPPPGGAQDHQRHREGRDRRHGGLRGVAAVRHLGHHVADGRPAHDGRTGHDGQERPHRRPAEGLTE